MGEYWSSSDVVAWTDHDGPQRPPTGPPTAWYRGLAIGPMAQVSQVQLLQPVLSILWAALLLREHVGWATVVGGLLVGACARSAVRQRLAPRRT